MAAKKYIQLARKSLLSSVYDFSSIKEGGGHFGNGSCDLTPMTVADVRAEFSKYFDFSVALNRDTLRIRLTPSQFDGLSDDEYKQMFRPLDLDIEKRYIGKGTDNTVFSHKCGKDTKDKEENVAYRVSNNFVDTEVNGKHRYIKEKHYADDDDDGIDIVFIIRNFILEMETQIELASRGLAPNVYMIGIVRNKDADAISLFSFQQLMHPIKTLNIDITSKIMLLLDKVSENYLFIDIKPDNLLVDKPPIISVFASDYSESTPYMIDVDYNYLITDDFLVWAIEKSIQGRPSIVSRYENLTLQNIRANIMKYLFFLYCYFWYSFPRQITTEIYTMVDSPLKKYICDFMNEYSSDMILLVLSNMVLYQYQDNSNKSFGLQSFSLSEIIRAYHFDENVPNPHLLAPFINNQPKVRPTIRPIYAKKIVNLNALGNIDLHKLYPEYDDLCSPQKKSTLRDHARNAVRSIFRGPS